jgi:hypothetical protein
MLYTKVGTISTDLKPNDMVDGSWSTRDQVPQKYWDKVENPEYNPLLALEYIPDAGEGVVVNIEYDVTYEEPEFIFTNTFRLSLGNAGAEGSWEFMADGQWKDITSLDELMAKLIDEATRLTTLFIQEPVDAFNSMNGTAFHDVHSCANYMNNPAYTHITFCTNVWNWSVEVWEVARDIQGQVLSGAIEAPSPEEFLGMLPIFTLGD